MSTPGVIVGLLIFFMGVFTGAMWHYVRHATTQRELEDARAALVRITRSATRSRL